MTKAFCVNIKLAPVSMLEIGSALQGPSLCRIHKNLQDFQPV